MYFEGSKGSSPTTTGINLIALVGSLIPFSIIVGAVVRRTGHYRWAIWSGWVIITLASGLLILLSPDTSVYTWVLILVIAGMGHGLVLLALNIGTQAMVDGPDVGFAAVLYTFSRSAGLCFGVAIGSTVFQNTLQAHLASHGLPAELAGNIEGLMYELRGSPSAMVFRVPISQSFDNLAEMMTGIAALGGMLSLLIKSSSVDRSFKPEHVLRGDTNSGAPQECASQKPTAQK